MQILKILFLCFFVIPICWYCKASTNNNENIVPSSLKKVEDSSNIFVKFEKSTSSFPAFSIYDEFENQSMIIATDLKWQLIPWKSTYTFCLGTSVFNAVYPIKGGDSIIINNKGKYGFDVKIINSIFNPYEINFFNILSLKNQNMLDFYLRKKIPNSTYPTQVSARVAFDSCVFNLHSALIDQRIDKKYYEWAKKIILFSYSAALEKPDKPNASLFLDSTNLENHFFRKFLQNYLINYQLNSTFAKVNFDKAYTFSKINFDGALKDYLMFFTTKNLVEKFNLTRKANISRFIKDVSKDSYKSYFINNYAPIEDLKIAMGQNILLTIDGKKRISLEEILKENKGKLIFIDFWASWCTPCIASLPDTKKLRETYLSNKICFLYISIDSKILDWKNAIKRYGLELDGHSYLLANAKEADITKRFGIREIPRYILLGSDGAIISENAPSPGTEELSVLIEEHLTK